MQIFFILLVRYLYLFDVSKSVGAYITHTRQMFNTTVVQKLLDSIEINLANNLRHVEKSDSSRFMGEHVPRGSKLQDKLTQITEPPYVYWFGQH